MWYSMALALASMSMAASMTVAPVRPRFTVGDQVECNVGKLDWVRGKVIAVNYRTKEGDVVPYRVALNNGKYILAPNDRMTCIRESTTTDLFGSIKFGDGEAELEALFYSFDLDNSGAIDEAEMSLALEELGYALPDEEAAELFATHAEDGAIRFDHFKAVIGYLKETGVPSTASVKMAMNLFRKFDRDGSGTIDKNEFREIAMAMAEERKRKVLFAGAAAAATSLAVAKTGMLTDFLA